ncbi:hypothetical protein DPMN_019914 [Dreissena polymorpha]|uniref:Uncharacterized protein n=1 Tax=Dreissena polymorpha TaxID=45954 RepID=A0A9D4NL99_DREPO|nr:hypothetical protein DPMN_019914 [Dreissena polymorpha]
MVTVVTIAKDNNFRVWDRSRDKKRATDRQAKSRRVPLGHQDELFVTGSAGEDSPNIVGVYDVGRLEYRTIRELVRRRVLFRSLLIVCVLFPFASMSFDNI